MKNILWIILVLLVGRMLYQNKQMSSSRFNLIDVQLADKQKGAQIIAEWKNSHSGDTSLLTVARANTKLDFLFILVYVLQLITLNNALMQREKKLMHNELLRLNLMLAVVIGLLDVSENFVLLHNFHFAGDENAFISTCYLSYGKWIVAGYVLLIMLASRIKRINP